MPSRPQRPTSPAVRAVPDVGVGLSDHLTWLAHRGAEALIDSLSNVMPDSRTCETMAGGQRIAKMPASRQRVNVRRGGGREHLLRLPSLANSRPGGGGEALAATRLLPRPRIRRNRICRVTSRLLRIHLMNQPAPPPGINDG